MSTDVVCITPIQSNVVPDLQQGRLKTELRNLRRRGAKNALGEEEASQGRSCARCKAPLGRIYNTGASCPRCRHRVCRQCREYRGSSNGTDWLCLVCHKIIEIRAVSGEWMNEASGNKRIARKKFLASPADILRRSIRRSWTINGPPASWCAVRGSPELRAYQSLPRHQDYFDVSRSDFVIPDGSLKYNQLKSNDIQDGIQSSFVVNFQQGDNRRDNKSGDFNIAENSSRKETKEEEEDKEKDKDKTDSNTPRVLSTLNNEENRQEILNDTPRISQIKPPRIHSKIYFNEAKQTTPKSNERKSNIPILRRSSKEFEDIRSPIESAKRSLIPQRYRGSTDDLRRSREDITAPSQIPKLFSPRCKEDRLIKRQDSKDEIRCGIGKLTGLRKEKEERKDIRDISSLPKSSGNNAASPNNKREDESRQDIILKSGIKIFRRDIKDGCESYKINKFVRNNKGEDKNTDDITIENLQCQSFGEENLKLQLKLKENSNDKKEDEDTIDFKSENDNTKNITADFKDYLVTVKDPDDMVEERESPNSKEPIKGETKIEGFEWHEMKKQNENEESRGGGSLDTKTKNEDLENSSNDRGELDKNIEDIKGAEKIETRNKEDDNDNNCQEFTPPEEKEASPDYVADNNLQKKTQDDYQAVTRRKFSKEEFSNTDDTDEVPNRRSSSHLSPEASPLSTRSSRYSPRESESEPTPALPRKTGESSGASQRVRDAITRTRRESNSSARYESSGSESIRLSGHVETRRVRFGGGSGIEEVQRDSATSAGEDEPRNSPHNSSGQRDSRINPGAIQSRAVRRRRQFDTQGTRRRGRSHARNCAEDFHHHHHHHHLQITTRGNNSASDHLSPPQGGQQGQQEHPIIDYRRLVFISSDSSSGREEDDADSSSGSSSLNGASRSSLAQGLEDCDWDYFESGGSVPPLAHLQVGLIGNTNILSNTSNDIHGSSASRGHPGISLSSQDWSCCPGRGSSACQACGGARGANVFPVPVPIPVPVPYPVPVPASLWASGLTNTSMINCTSAELGAIQLSRGGSGGGGGGPSQLHPANAAQWFAWPPRFIHDVNQPRQNDTQGFLDQRSREAAAAAAAAAAATFAFHQAREFNQINLHASVVAAEFTGTVNSPNSSNEQTDKIVKEEINKVPDNNDVDKDNKDVITEEPEAESSDNEGELDVKSTTNSTNSQSENSTKMYRLSQGNSGSTSGRSSADSSDLEDSASHHFSRVFVVNDDSSTSDNDQDAEDVEDSDSNREVGITLRRVTALPEDGTVVLRHVRFLDEDRNPMEIKKNSDASGLESSKKEIKNLKTVCSKDEEIKLKYMKNFDPEANEIYLVDSKEDDSEHCIELKSVRSIDPDVIENPIESQVCNIENIVEIPDPDSLMSAETMTENRTIVPDSLEINENSLPQENSHRSNYNSEESDDGILPNDIHGSRIPELKNFDKPGIIMVTCEDKQQQQQQQLGLLSGVYDDTVTAATSCSEVLIPHSPMSSVNENKKLNIDESVNLNLNLNLTGSSERSTTGSSETTTASEVSSDELHEYEITAWSSSPQDQEEEYGVEDVSDNRSFHAVNDDLIIACNLLINGNNKLEIETSDLGAYNQYKDDNLTQNLETVSGFISDGFSTDEGGSSGRLDSGVATGIEDTNPSGRTDDGSIASLETTPGESIELVHYPGGIVSDADNNEKRYSDAGISGNNKNEEDVSIDNKLNDEKKEEKVEGEEDCDFSNEKSEKKINNGEKNTSLLKVNKEQDHTVNDLISIKIHEIFKSVECRNDGIEERSGGGGEEEKEAEEFGVKINGNEKKLDCEESGAIVCGGERTELKQVEGGIERVGTTATAEVSSVVRRPPVVEDGSYAAGVVPSSQKSYPVKNNIQNNRYKSLVMITQGAYQPVNVVTSDTTTLLQPDESPSPPRGLAGYYHLALETATELPNRNANSGPRRPLTVKRPTPQSRVVNIEPEVDSGLSVGSASESDDVQSVKSAAKVSTPVTVTSSSDQNVSNSIANNIGVEKSSPNDSSPRNRSAEVASSSGVVVILEEGLADDDSWVEEVSHDEDEQGGTTATEESSEDEANNIGDREEELRGYHRQAIDFTLHTIVEESCEESEAEPSSLAIGSPRKQRPPSASELEKYFFFGLGEGAGNIGGSREIDSLSETSSIYSEGLESLGQDEPGQIIDKNSPDYLSSSSRLEKYFLSDFLGFDRDRRDSDGSVGSDSEGRPSPEQRRKRLVRARGTGRSHSSSLDNLLALTQSSANLSSQNSLQDLSLNPDSQETQSEGSSTETDGADDQMPAFGTDGQFDTVKRKKKKPRNLGTQSPRISDDRNKTPEPSAIEADGDLLETMNSDDDRAKTPQPDIAFLTSSQSTESGRTKQTLQASDSAHPNGRGKHPQCESARGNVGQGNDVNLTRSKQHSRDSGFIGSCDDLLQHQRVSSSNDSQNSNGGQDQGKKDLHHERRSMNDTKYKEGGGGGGGGGGTSSKIEQPLSQVNLAPPNASLSRKDSFNNWSSDEETNLMMSKMRQFFKTMVANSNNGQNSNNSSAASPAPSPRLPGSSPRCRIATQNRTKPPQLVYFENELTRLMKTVPGIRDEQVKEIVEYLSSEDTWSDSYDSSDYTSSDLEGAGGRRSALQEQISQSCQQIINKFDTTGTTENTLTGKETIPSTQPAQVQPLNCRDTAFVYQKLVQSFTKMTGDGVSSDASSTPHSSPPLIAKVMHHIGSRLVALMHEVSEGGPAVQPSSWRRYPHHRTPSSASTTEDDDSTSDSANTPIQHQLPRSKSHDPLLLLNGHPATGYQEGEEREASDNERFSWRGSFESALMPADSRTKLSLLACSGDVSASASALAMAAKRRSAGDLLFNPKSLSREQLDRVRSCGSIGGGTGSIEDKIWSNRRRSSVPDANTRGESGASAGDDDTEDELEYNGDSRATTLPRGLQSVATATNSLPRLPAVSPTSGPVTMHKAHSVHHFLQQHNNVKSARYRPPGFARNNITTGATGGPKRAVSAPGLQLPAGSNSAGKRDTARNRRQAVSLAPDDGSSLSEACSTPIIGGVRGGGLSNDDDTDRSLHAGLLGNRASSSSLGARSDSMASVYSGAGEGRWCGSVAVKGGVEFSLQYDYKQKTFEVRVTQCKELAPVDVKRNWPDPYVKVYLLPDKSKGGKRKTKVKKHTLNPVFNETLKFHMGLNELKTRTLWLTVWHSDMFGRNDFLGEVRIALENKIFDDPTPLWYPLQERSEPFDDPIACKGEVIVGLKFVPPDSTQQHERLGDRSGIGDKVGSKTRKSCSKGALHVLVKEARNLQTRAKHGGTCDPFCKSYLLPDKGRSGKQKTGVVRRCTGGSPVWGHTFVYKDVSLQELADRGLELTVWDHDRIASNEFLGGVRFNLGTGKHNEKAVEWMDATGRELSLWQNMLERPNFWVEGAVTLRPNLHSHPRNNTT